MERAGKARRRCPQLLQVRNGRERFGVIQHLVRPSRGRGLCRPATWSLFVGLYVSFSRGRLFLVGRRGGGVGCRGLLGWVCPKRRGLKPRWRGCLQETRRWPGVFVVFPVCFRCAFGVVLHGARVDLLRFGHLAPSLRRAGIRVRASGAGRAGMGHSRSREHRRGRGLAPPTRLWDRSRGPGPYRQGRSRP